MKVIPAPCTLNSISTFVFQYYLYLSILSYNDKLLLTTFIC
jgi:accessory gene regulator protein AgrB